MGAVGLCRQVATGKLVPALRAGFDRGEAVLDRVVDGLIIADSKCKKSRVSVAPQ